MVHGNALLERGGREGGRENSTKFNISHTVAYPIGVCTCTCMYNVYMYMYICQLHVYTCIHLLMFGSLFVIFLELSGNIKINCSQAGVYLHIYTSWPWFIYYTYIYTCTCTHIQCSRVLCNAYFTALIVQTHSHGPPFNHCRQSLLYGHILVALYVKQLKRNKYSIHCTYSVNLTVLQSHCEILHSFV